MSSGKCKEKLFQFCQAVLRKIWEVFRLGENPIGATEAVDLIKNLEDAWREWRHAKQYFNSVNDPDLIDHAIFYMDATEKKYIYLLKQARETGINVDRFNLA